MAYSKPSIFIDANALSHISSIDLNKRKVSNWLWSYFEVKTCTAVKNEFLKNVNKRGADSKALSRKLNSDPNLVPRSRHLSRLEQEWLSNEYYLKTLSKKDEGERHLVCIALEYLYKKNSSYVIIVTDDNSARNYFLKKILDDLPFGALWTSLDLILYMYFAFKDVSFEFAYNSIRDISSFDSYGFKEFRSGGETEADARQRMLSHYVNKLNKMKIFKQKIS